MTQRCDLSPVWAELQAHFAATGRSFDLRAAFAADADRFATLSFEAPEVFADLSKNRLDAPTLALLVKLARDCGLEARRDALLRGDPVNRTEGRAVLHTARRWTRCWPLPRACAAVIEVRSWMSSISALAAATSAPPWSCRRCRRMAGAT